MTLKGYLDFFHEPGVAHFMETTFGWEQAYRTDDPPLYPRRAEVEIPANLQARFDSLIASAVERDQARPT